MVDRGTPRGIGPARFLRSILFCARTATILILCRTTIAPCVAEDRIENRRTTERVTGGATSTPGSPAPAPAPATIALFQIHCSICHDSDGRGAIGRDVMRTIPDFTDEAWQSSRSDQQLRRSISEGKGKSMPAMRAKFDPNDVVKLVALVRRFRGGQWVVPEEETEPQETSPHRPAPREATRVAAPAPSRWDLPLDPGAGTVAGHVERAIFQRSCQICHGADGRGAPSGSRLPGIPDFTSRAWQEGRSQAQLEASILEGKGERMPAFRDKLGAEQVSALAAFVRAFGPPQARPPSAPSGDFDDRLTRLQREFEELRRVYRKLSPPPPSGADPDTIE